MQCIILAAGEGRRMRPLTLERPKPLVHVAGAPILEHIISSLPDKIDEVILVIGYKGDMIVDHFGDQAFGKKITYVWQQEPKGTGAALLEAQHLIRDKFLILYGDDLVHTNSLHEAIEHDLAVLAIEHEEPHRFGVILTKDDDTVGDILEKPNDPPSRLVSTSGMVLDERIFSHIGPRDGYSEVYLSHAVASLAKEMPVRVVRMSFWCPVGTPEDIPKAETLLLAGAHLLVSSTPV